MNILKKIKKISWVLNLIMSLVQTIFIVVPAFQAEPENPPIQIINVTNIIAPA